MNIMCRTRPLDGETGICGMLGYPVQYSITPIMYSEIFEKTGINCVYMPFNVKPENLEDAIRGYRALPIRASGVTMPHKHAVLQYLDELDPGAEAIGGCSIITNINGVLKGYNGDTPGFMYPLRKYDLKGKKVVLLGAGGAGSAISYGLAGTGVELVIMDGNNEASKSLTAKMEKYTTNKIRWAAFTDENLKKEISDAFMLVNATSVGFGPQKDLMIVPPTLLRADLIVYDIVMSETTKLVDAAKAIGAETIRGFFMPAGVAQFLFPALTGKEPPADIYEIYETAALHAIEYRAAMTQAAR